MNLFQDEMFFRNHFDPEVRNRGLRLIEIINKLQTELMGHSFFANTPVVTRKTRMQEITIHAILQAIDRHGGNKTDAAKWLGISRQGMYCTLDAWNKTKVTLSSKPPNTNSLPNHPNGTTARQCAKRDPTS